jgi:hypothetical protein
MPPPRHRIRSKAIMRVTFGPRTYDFPSDSLGELRDSNELLGDAGALRERMAEDGYLLLRQLIDPGKVAAARRTVFEYMNEREALVPGTPVLEGVMPRGGRSVPIMGRKGITHHPAVRQVLEASELFDFYQNYFGETALTFDYKWLRAVGNEGYTGAHYDVVYMGRGSERLHTCWIPLGDIPIEQGTLAICVGSHNHPRFENLRQTYGRMDVDRDLIEGWFTNDPLEITQKFGGQWQTTHFAAGDVITFGMFTLHASTTNTTTRYRLSCDVRYQPAADPVDERWAGDNPRGHDAWQSGTRKLVPMAMARKTWGV